MDDNTAAVKLFNDAAEMYQQKYMDVDLYKNSLEKFREDLVEGSSIMDLACGPGNILKYLVSSGRRYKLSGIDLSEKMIELAKENVPSAEYRIQDCTSLENVTEKYNGVVCNFLIPYLNKDQVCVLVEKIHTLLFDNGKLFIGFIAGESNRSEIVQTSTGASMRINYYDPKFIEALLLKCKFIIQHIEFCKSPNPNQVQHDVIIVARK